MKIDKTVNVGTLVHLAGVLITLVALYAGISSRLTSLETKVDAMWAWFAVRMEQIDGRR